MLQISANCRSSSRRTCNWLGAPRSIHSPPNMFNAQLLPQTSCCFSAWREPPGVQEGESASLVRPLPARDGATHELHCGTRTSRSVHHAVQGDFPAKAVNFAAATVRRTVGVAIRFFAAATNYLERECHSAMSQVFYRGSCLCGELKYEVSAEIQSVSHCHCSMCRKAHGAAFATYGSVLRENHRFVSGIAQLRSHRSSKLVTRMFCAICGSPMLWQSEGDFANLSSFPLGSLDVEYRAPKHRHIHVASKATWYDITDQWPQAHEY